MNTFLKLLATFLAVMSFAYSQDEGRARELHLRLVSQESISAFDIAIAVIKGGSVLCTSYQQQAGMLFPPQKVREFLIQEVPAGQVRVISIPCEWDCRGIYFEKEIEVAELGRTVIEVPVTPIHSSQVAVTIVGPSGAPLEKQHYVGFEDFTNGRIMVENRGRKFPLYDGKTVDDRGIFSFTGFPGRQYRLTTEYEGITYQSPLFMCNGDSPNQFSWKIDYGRRVHLTVYRYVAGKKVLFDELGCLGVFNEKTGAGCMLRNAKTTLDIDNGGFFAGSKHIRLSEDYRGMKIVSGVEFEVTDEKDQYHDVIFASKEEVWPPAEPVKGSIPTPASNSPLPVEPVAPVVPVAAAETSYMKWAVIALLVLAVTIGVLKRLRSRG